MAKLCDLKLGPARRSEHILTDHIRRYIVFSSMRQPLISSACSPTRPGCACSFSLSRRNFPWLNCRIFSGWGSRVFPVTRPTETGGSGGRSPRGQECLLRPNERQKLGPTAREGERTDPRPGARDAGNKRDRTALKIVLRKRQDKALGIISTSWRSLRPQLLPGPVLAGARSHSDRVASAADGSGSRRRRRNAGAVTRENARKLSRSIMPRRWWSTRGHWRKKHGVQESRVSPRRHRGSADRKNSIDLAIFSQALHHAIHPEARHEAGPSYSKKVDASSCSIC